MRCLSLFLLVGLFAACNSDPRQHVRIDTPLGTMHAVLYDETPLHRDNFIKLAGESYYDTLLWHRVMDGFMVQGGDPDSRNPTPGAMYGTGDPGYTIPAEIGAPHLRGALAAARMGGPMNPQKESSGSQFYIVDGQKVSLAALEQQARAKGLTYNEAQKQLYATEGGTPQLDGDYTVFGELTDGFDVLDKLSAVPTGRADRPVEDVWMVVALED